MAVLVALLVRSERKAATRAAAVKEVVDKLDNVSVACDGSSLQIHRPDSWNEDDGLDLEARVEMRQVFQVSISGHEPFAIYHLCDDGLVTEVGFELPEGFEQGVTITPQPFYFYVLSAGDLRSREMPRWSVEKNLNQKQIDGTVVELKDHEIRYKVSRNYHTLATTDWVSYKPSQEA